MKKAFTVLAFCLLTLVSANAADRFTVEDAWVREAPPGAMALAAYMNIRNTGDSDRKLVSASSADFGAVELHRSIVEGGMARMVPQESMPIPAGGELALKPGDYHLMLLRPKSALEEGDQVTLSLSFDDGSSVEVTMPVRKAGGTGHDHMHHHHEHSHDTHHQQ